MVIMTQNFAADLCLKYRFLYFFAVVDILKMSNYCTTFIFILQNEFMIFLAITLEKIDIFIYIFHLPILLF